MSSLYGAGQGLRGPTGQGLGSRSPGQGLQGPGRSTPRGYEQVQNFTPEQMDLFKQLFSNVGPDSFLSKLAGGDEGTFNQIEAPALRQFNGLQGNLASRFSGMGGLGARHSSGFQNTANQAASDFAGQLQGQRQSLQQQALSDLMGYSNQLLGQQPNSLIEKQKPFWQQLLMSVGGGIGQIFGNMGGSMANQWGQNKMNQWMTPNQQNQRMGQ